MTLIAKIAFSSLPLDIVMSEEGYMLFPLLLTAALSVTPHVSQLRNLVFDCKFPLLVPAGSAVVS